MTERMKYVWSEKPVEPELKPLIHKVYSWIITSDNQVVIVSKDGNNWQLPGGTLENEDLIVGLYREINEETGLSPDLVKYVTCIGHDRIVDVDSSPPNTKFIQLKFAIMLKKTAEQVKPLLHTKERPQDPPESKIKFIEVLPFEKACASIQYICHPTRAEEKQSIINFYEQATQPDVLQP